jgi:hypothetical protein
MFKNVLALSPSLVLFLVASEAFAQTTVTPPADIAQAVTAPKVAGEAPPEPPPPLTDTLNAAISAGGQFATGNSKLAAASGLGKMDIRRGNNAFAASLGGNYAESYVVPSITIVPGVNGGKPTEIPAAPAAWKESTENIQAKLRYDRFVSRPLSFFLQLTGTHDAFQAISLRLNIDPGIKYIFAQDDATRFWGEIGYDLQWDDNYTDVNGIEQAGAGGPQLDPNSIQYLIQKNDTIHSGRAFAGVQHKFNTDVSLSVGLEYLQGFGGSGGSAPGVPNGYFAYNASTVSKYALTQQVDPVSIPLTGSRLNLDLLLAAKLVAGVSFGVAFSAKYNSDPLAGKTNLDTASTLTLIYAFGSTNKPVEKKIEPCAPPPPPPPPASAPPPAAPAPIGVPVPPMAPVPAPPPSP